MRSKLLYWVIASYLIGTHCHHCFGQILDSDATVETRRKGSPSGRQELALQRSATARGLPSATSSRSTIRAISWTTSQRLRADALATTATERLQSALVLLGTLCDLQSDPRIANSSSLQLARKKVMARLRAIQKRTEAEVRRRKRKPQQIDIDQTVLAQLNQAVGNNNLAAAGNPANGGNANQDYGTLLVNLIQRTISPNSWDVNGGLSSLQYWRPGRALVVRAPQAVHDDLSPLLLQPRKQ